VKSIATKHVGPWTWTRASTQVLIYAALLTWAFICLFPIYWTFSTSFKTAVNVTQGHIIPFTAQFPGDWKGWRSLGLSPDTFFETSTVRDEFMQALFKQRDCVNRRVIFSALDWCAGCLWPRALPL